MPSRSVSSFPTPSMTQSAPWPAVRALTASGTETSRELKVASAPSSPAFRSFSRERTAQRTRAP